MSSGEGGIGGKSQGRGSDMFLSTSLTRATAGREVGCLCARGDYLGSILGESTCVQDS